MALLELYTTLSSTLKQFRLISLLPDSGSSTIECTLRIDNLLRGAPEGGYEALSYEWGDTNSPTHEIMLEGNPFRVRENLWLALRSMRASSSGRSLWIDALCINQHNTSERNQQVAMMGEIFKEARSVRVWLGEDEGNIHKYVFDLVRNAGFLSDEPTYKELASRDLHCPLNELGKQLSISPEIKSLASPFTSQRVWEALASLLERTYWTRLWIVQEYLLARQVTIYCGWQSSRPKPSQQDHGPKSINFTTFDEGLDKIARIKSNDPFAPPFLSEILERIKTSPGMGISSLGFRVRSRFQVQEQTLLELLETCKKSKSSVPHDRIYALLGAATDITEASIPVDYDRPIFKVKMDVAWFIHSKPRYIPGMAHRICSILDDIFADVEEESDESD